MAGLKREKNQKVAIIELERYSSRNQKGENHILNKRRDISSTLKASKTAQLENIMSIFYQDYKAEKNGVLYEGETARKLMITLRSGFFLGGISCGSKSDQRT